jgi:hypothetical protein
MTKSEVKAVCPEAYYSGLTRTWHFSANLPTYTKLRLASGCIRAEMAYKFE